MKNTDAYLTSIGSSLIRRLRRLTQIKMSLAKAQRETLYWIRLLKKSGYLNEYSKLELLDSEIRSIVKIITSIVKTTQN